MRGRNHSRFSYTLWMAGWLKVSEQGKFWQATFRTIRETRPEIPLDLRAKGLTAAEIQSGTVISMAYNLVDGVPLFGTRFTKTMLTTASLVPGAEYGKNKLTYMEDTYLSQSHVGTHIDGMGHIGIMDCYYNQTPMGKFVTQNGLKKLGLENLKTFATRGVIIDMVKVFQDAGKLKTNPACRTPCLDGGTVITDADIQAGLKMYNVSLR